MLYVTGIHALNLPCQLNTCGDWHASALRWENPTICESENSLWGEYGIEKDHKIPGHTRSMPAANHIRALLDLIQEGRLDIAQGMNKDYICNDKYNAEIFEKVFLLRDSADWERIERFMHREYGKEWRIWKNGRLCTKA